MIFFSCKKIQLLQERHEDNLMKMHFNAIYDTLLYSVFYLAFSIIIPIDSSHLVMVKGPLVLTGNRGSFPTKY